MVVRYRILTLPATMQVRSFHRSNGLFRNLYVGTLVGITNTLASIPGFVAPYIVGAITNNNVSVTLEALQRSISILVANAARVAIDLQSVGGHRSLRLYLLLHLLRWQRTIVEPTWCGERRSIRTLVSSFVTPMRTEKAMTGKDIENQFCIPSIHCAENNTKLFSTGLTPDRFIHAPRITRRRSVAMNSIETVVLGCIVCMIPR